MRALPLLLLAAFAMKAGAVENAYDVLGKVLLPLAQVLAESPKTPNRAVKLSFRLEGATGALESAAGEAAQLKIEVPDHLKFIAPWGGEQVTLVRRGPELWAFPGGRLKALLADPAMVKHLPPPDPKFKLQPLHLPIPEKQLAFLPVLFSVRDGGMSALDGEECRVLDVGVTPALSKSLAMREGTTARLWVGDAYRLAKLQLQTGETSVVLQVAEMKLLRTFPKEEWLPTPEQSSDVLLLSPVLYDQLWRGIFSGVAGRSLGKTKLPDHPR